MKLSPDDLNRRRQKALRIHELLIEEYGPRKQKHRQLDPLSELVYTILSQNTADVNTERTVRQLRERFPTWEAVRDAPAEEVIDAIRLGGLAEQKGPRIQAILRQITEERGELNLDFLAGMSVDDARAWLVRLVGVGPKTAAIVLLFSLDKPAFPVDTHVHRLSQRLGLVPPKTGAGKTGLLLEQMMPPETYYPFHVNLIAHGRRVCKARRPRCEICRLADLCDHFCGVVRQAMESVIGTGQAPK
ncbi:MAG: endonuclease III [Chloroflexi bacterium]|nr:endonuclease III [Chloroflexota bacterium]